MFPFLFFFFKLIMCFQHNVFPCFFFFTNYCFFCFPIYFQIFQTRNNNIKIWVPCLFQFLFSPILVSHNQFPNRIFPIIFFATYLDIQIQPAHPQSNQPTDHRTTNQPTNNQSTNQNTNQQTNHPTNQSGWWVVASGGQCFQLDPKP